MAEKVIDVKTGNPNIVNPAQPNPTIVTWPEPGPGQGIPVPQQVPGQTTRTNRG